ncbi:peptide chain release factor N(5)-glutamine methyltransferase [Megalodesulfovibrio paquesii]
MVLPPGCTVRQARLALAAEFERAGVDSPGLSARILVAHALGADESIHYMTPDRLVPAEALARLLALALRRSAGEPVAYLTGRKEFFGIEFQVGPGCLVPRPETELLIEAALAAFSPESALHFVDCGTGSGCLAATLALQFPQARGVAVDRSREALAWAGRNLACHGLTRRVALVEADFACLPVPDAWADVVVANPPYVSPAEYAALGHEVREFEPLAALVPRDAPPMDDGLAALAGLATEAGRALRPGGLFVCEIGWLQGRQGRGMLEQAGWFEALEVVPDLAGLDRMLRARKKAR